MHPHLFKNITKFNSYYNLNSYRTLRYMHARSPYTLMYTNHLHAPPRASEMDVVSTLLPKLSNQPLSWWASGISGLIDITLLNPTLRERPPKSDTLTLFTATTGNFPSSSKPSASAPHRVELTMWLERSTSCISRLVSFLLALVIIVLILETSLHTPITSGKKDFQNLIHSMTHVCRCKTELLLSNCV